MLIYVSPYTRQMIQWVCCQSSVSLYRRQSMMRNKLYINSLVNNFRWDLRFPTFHSSLSC